MNDAALSPEAQDSRDPSSERGAALIVVMSLLMAVTVLVVSVLSGVDGSLKTQRLTNDTMTLQFVLQAGIADAMNELKNEVDYDGDGLGAVGTGLPSGTPDGVAIKVGGRLMGHYRATIDSSDPENLILNVVAAYPDFTNPVQTLAARTVVAQGGPEGLFDRNALTLYIPEEGVKDPKKKLFKIDDSATVSITDPSGQVPAVNITNTEFLASFLAAFDDTKPNITIDGQGGNGADTVTNNAGSLLTAENLKELARSISDYVDNATIDVTVGVGLKKDNHIDAKNYPDPSVLQNLGGAGKVVVFDENAGEGKGKKLKIDGMAVSGSGTLIISRELELKKGASLTWDGDVIIYSDDKKKAKLKMHGGEFKVTGNVILVANPDKKSKVDLHFHGKKEYANLIKVDGSFVALSAGEGDKGDVKLKLHEGGKKVESEPHLLINGLFAVLGTKIDFELKGKKDDKDDDDDDVDDGHDTLLDGTSLVVNGSAVFAVATNLDSKKKADALKKFKLKKDTNFIATFNNPNFESALTGLATFFSALPKPPELEWGRAGYVEVKGGKGVQDTALSAAKSANKTLGVPETP